ncbi:hypothetical protein Leryth_001914 [Lithospermum erythrorhizon]|nr:hypothetical protein Leryth_001914 [Lithospermum erythrorhizon]
MFTDLGLLGLLQIKDIAVKASGAYKNCKPCSGSGSADHKKYVDSENGSVSERFPCAYKRAGRGANSMPRVWGKEMEARLKALSSGEGTPVSVSSRTESVVFVEDDDVEPKEWVAQIEPGVLITFVALPHGGNALRGIRFSREMFNKLQAQHWWSDNYEKVMELYNVQRSNFRTAPLKSEDEVSRNSSNEESHVTPSVEKEGIGYSSSDSLEHLPKHAPHCQDSCGLTSTPKVSSISTAKIETSSIDASARTSSSRDQDHSGELSVSNASEIETEWVEEDVPGVYITIRALPDGSRELRRVRFSRETFGETQARMWWEQNRARIQEQYL